MNNISLDILKAIIAHTSHQEPGADVGILLGGQWTLTLTTSIDIERGKVAGELASVLGD